MTAATPAPPRRPDWWVPRVAVVLAVLGTSTIAWLVFRSGDGSDASAGSTAPTELPSIVSATATTGALATTTTLLATTTTLPATTTTIVDTTTTVPETTTTVPETTTTVPSAAAVPPVPVPEIFAGPGNPQIMNDPLPSAVAIDIVRPALAKAQQVADLIAAGDWAGLRDQQLLPNGFDEAVYEARWGPVDRMSLLLLDVRPLGDGFRLLLGAVATSISQNSTTVSCFEWYADLAAADIYRADDLNSYPGFQFGPEALRNDPSEDAKLRAGCAWATPA